MPVEHVSLSRCRVLYLGSAIPLETAVGIEALQGPCRDRYDNVDSDNRASGIDAILSVYSSGLFLQYASDESSSSWFPIQTLHVCAAVKAVGSNGPLRFVSLDTPAAQRSSSPPMFACIMRRTKGVKVLECHVFICKSNQAAMALVQSCMHAFGHKEGWMDGSSMPATRIVPAGKKSVRGGGKRSGGSVRGGDLFSDRMDLIQKFDVNCRIDDKPKEHEGHGCNQMVIMQGPAAPAQPQPQPQPQQQMMVPMNPPGAPIGMVPANYFADWGSYGGQPLMIIPNSPFYPGDEEMERHRKKKRKKKKKKAQEKSDSEEETIFIKRSELVGGGNSGGCKGGYCGDSLRSRMRGRHGHGGCCEVVEEIVQPPGPPIIIPPPPRPCPQPQIVILPQPPPPAPCCPPPPQPPPPQPNVNKEDKSNRDVIVYAPQYIEANKRNTKIDYDDADKYAYDNRPDNRIYYENDERFLSDSRADNRINYNRQNYRNDDYRQDNRRFDTHMDRRSFDYRADNRSNREDSRYFNQQADIRSNREDNRRMDYRADNRSNMMTNHQAAAYGMEMYDPEYGYDAQGAQRDAFEAGYYDAQAEEYNRYLAEDCDDDDGYYPEGYYVAQPGYTDDYGEAGYAEYMPQAPQGHYELQAAPQPQGHYEIGYHDDYVMNYTGQPVGGGQVGYMEAANGLGYYP